MTNKKFAFESDEVSIALMLTPALGDLVLARKIFDALIKLAPNCLIDIISYNEPAKIYIKAFYGDSKNLNKIINLQNVSEEFFQNYDAALSVSTAHAILIEHVNVQRIKLMSPTLFESIIKLDAYNKENVYPFMHSNFFSYHLRLRNVMLARILNKTCYEILSCEGALPISEDTGKIPLLSGYKSHFDSLGLKKYITIYSNIERDNMPPKIKTWSIHYLREYVSLLKKRLPQIEIIQCGGGGDIKVDNADRHYLGVDLELTKHILANSLLHVGCEGGLIHLATALGTKCLVLFGSSHAPFQSYPQNINLVSDVCNSCMYISDGGDSRTCLRGAKEPPCMLSHTPQHVCEVTCTCLQHLDLKNKA